MTSTTTTDAKAALIVIEFGKLVWKCPNCRKMIGELKGQRLVVIVKGRQLTFPRVNGMSQSCPDCGFESHYRAP